MKRNKATSWIGLAFIILIVVIVATVAMDALEKAALPAGFMQLILALLMIALILIYYKKYRDGGIQRQSFMLVAVIAGMGAAFNLIAGIFQVLGK